MAKNEKSGNETGIGTSPVTPGAVEEPAKEESAPKPPAGFDISAGSQRGDGWVKKVAKAVVLGRLMGRFAMPADGKKRRYFYQVRLYQPCLAIVGKGDESKEEMLPEGAILNVDESKAFKMLALYAESDGVYDVWACYGKKQKIPGTNRTFWPAEVKAKEVKAPKTPLDRREFTNRLAEEDIEEGDDE